MNTYCVKSRKDTENIDPKIVTTATTKKRFVMQSKCSIIKCFVLNVYKNE